MFFSGCISGKDTDIVIKIKCVKKKKNIKSTIYHLDLQVVQGNKSISTIRMRALFMVYALTVLFSQDVLCILDFEDQLKTQISQANIIVTQVDSEIGSLGGLDDVKSKMESMKVDLQQDVNNSNVMEGIQSIHDFLDSESEILQSVSSSQILKAKIGGLLVGLEIQMDNLMSTLFDALESDIGNGLRRLGLKKLPKKDIKNLRHLTGNLTTLIKSLTKNDQIPASVMDILGKVKKKIKKGDLLNAITNGRLVNKTFLQDFPEIPEDELELLEDFQLTLLRVEEELNTTLGERIRKKLKLIDGDMFSKTSQKKVKRLLKDLEISVEEIDEIEFDEIDEGLFEKLDIEITDIMRRLGLDDVPTEDIEELEPFINFVSSVIDSLTKLDEIPEPIAKIARKVRKSLNEGDLLKAMRRARKINSTFLQDYLSMSEDKFEAIGDFEMGMLGIQKGIDKMLSRRLRKKLKLIEDGTFSNKTRRLMKKLLNSLGFQKKRKGRNKKKNKSKDDNKDIEDKLKTLKLDKIPDVDVKKLEPLSDVVTSLIGNLTKTSNVPTAITEITKEVETFVKDGDFVNAVKSARQLNSTFRKDFDTLSVEQIGIISDIEVASVAMHSGVDTLLDQRVAAAQTSTNDENEGTKAEWGVGTLVIGALVCLELYATF